MKFYEQEVTLKIRIPEAHVNHQNPRLGIAQQKGWKYVMEALQRVILVTQEAKYVGFEVEVLKIKRATGPHAP